MYQLTHPEHGETTVNTELALQRHFAAGWKLKEPQEKDTEQFNKLAAVAGVPKRTRKARQ